VPCGTECPVAPVRVPLTLPVRELVAGREQTCAHLDDGSLWCWGQNRQGEVSSALPVPVRTPARIEGLDAFGTLRRPHAGPFTSCASFESRAIACWGAGLLGEPLNSFPTLLAGVANVEEIAWAAWGTFSQSACVRLSSGQVRCWGQDDSGQLGDGPPRASQASPVEVIGARDTSALACGGLHCCALRAPGQAICWGQGVGGELGNGTAGAGVAQERPRSVVDMTVLTELDGDGCE
jgi:alpha-tubulin suppressor-like RCC1 family protein